ncbi:guanine nucleotide-binding protein subunit alpha-12-like [Paramisgurnus dabryanus]|uniref:guanine nucleotide-binding protein subunit alpha-12-like n=1 Tax=Paramisgurnus dabryanus TaxID=90735 RepID=UPI0031F35A02
MSKTLGWCLLPTTSDFKQEREARRSSRDIDVMLKRTSQEPVAILVLGISQSGKSTFIKQMRIINGPEFSQQELIDFRRTVYQNIIEGLQELVVKKTKMGIPWENSANETHEMLVMSVESWNMNLEPHTFQGFVTAINSLWNDSGIQEAYSKTKKINFFVSYIPCKQDILYAHKSCRDRDYFVHRNILITRSRSMWKYCFFDHNTTILFMAASSEFDQDLYGDNSLVESLNLFKSVLCNRFLRKCTIILFLNKTDLLAEKVQTADIRKNFPEFQGDPHSLEDVQRFLVECFRERITTVDDSHSFFYHFTTAVDTENIRIAFDSVKETIFRENVKNLMMQ